MAIINSSSITTGLVTTILPIVTIDTVITITTSTSILLHARR